MKKTAVKNVEKKPIKSEATPVTRAMLYEVRSELKHEITSSRIELKSDIKMLDAKMDHGLSAMDAKIEKVLSAVHRVGIMVEEQNARNLYVLDGYTSLNDRLEKVEKSANK